MKDESVAVGINLERYVAVLDVFAGLYDTGKRGLVGRSGDGLYLGVGDVSAELGISKGTVSRYLRRLETAGVLVRLPDKRYKLSPRVFFWGQAAKPGSDVQSIARPVMKSMAERFGEPVSLFVLASGVAVCIDQVDGNQPVRLNAQVGRQLPLHTGSSPRLLLAYAPEEIREATLANTPYPRLTPATLSTAEEIRAALEETRERGYVVSIGESNEGVVGIAAPIRDTSGEVVAALSMAGPESRLHGTWRDECLAAVREAADGLSLSLGYLQPMKAGAT